MNNSDEATQGSSELAPLVEEVEALLGQTVVDVSPQLAGGYTGQRVVRLSLEEGTTAVLKAVPQWNGAGDGSDFVQLRQEIELYRHVPELEAWRPRLLAEIVIEKWQAVLLQDLGPASVKTPWDTADLQAAADGLAAMHDATEGLAQPSGVLVRPPADMWPLLLAASLPSAWNHKEVSGWIERISSRASAAIAATPDAPCVTHGDLIAPNIFVLDRRLVLIDWALVGWASRARDAVTWALAVEAAGGSTAPAAYQLYIDCGPRIREAERMGALAVITGFILSQLVHFHGDAALLDRLERRLPAALAWFATEFRVSVPDLAPLRS